MSEHVVRAAGGVVVQTDNVDEEMILIVHRPRYDDWSLPKGKCEPGETEADCAAREVREETGLSCGVGPRITEVAYRDHKDRPKTVAYFLMERLGGEFAANDEVDEARWVTLRDAEALLSYTRDAEIAQLAVTQLR